MGLQLLKFQAAVTASRHVVDRPRPLMNRRSARQVFEEIRNGGVKVRSLFTLVSRNAPHVPRCGDEHLDVQPLRPPETHEPQPCRVLRSTM